MEYKYTNLLMVSDYCRSWTSSTPEASQVCCQPLCMGTGMGSPVSSHSAKHSTRVISQCFSVRPWYHSDRTRSIYAEVWLAHNSGLVRVASKTWISAQNFQTPYQWGSIISVTLKSKTKDCQSTEAWLLTILCVRYKINFQETYGIFLAN